MFSNMRASFIPDTYSQVYILYEMQNVLLPVYINYKIAYKKGISPPFMS